MPRKRPFKPPQLPRRGFRAEPGAARIRRSWGASRACKSSVDDSHKEPARWSRFGCEVGATFRWATAALVEVRLHRRERRRGHGVADVAVEAKTADIGLFFAKVLAQAGESGAFIGGGGLGAK